MKMVLVPPPTATTMRLVEVDMPWPPRVGEDILHPEGGSFKVQMVSYSFDDLAKPWNYKLRRVCIQLI